MGRIQNFNQLEARNHCLITSDWLKFGALPSIKVKISIWALAGNSGDSSSASPSRLEVELPYFPSGEAKRCALRLRYNISTADYDPWNIDSSSNDDE